jgi:hypothetical protein
MEQVKPRPTPTLDGPEWSPVRPKPVGAPGRVPLRFISRRKVLQVGLVAAGGVSGLVLISWGWAATRTWLLTRPAYRCAFDDIELAPPPPPWIKRGAEGVLASVRQGSGLPEQLDSQAIDLAVLRRAFAHHCPWVLEVVEVRRSFPNHLKVTLTYRQPVAEVIEPLENRRLALLDADAVVLPLDGTDLAAAGTLLQIWSSEIPEGVREGLAWPDDKGQSGPDPVMAQLVRLAAFVKRRNRSLGLRAIPFHLVHALPESGLFLGASENRWVRWRRSVLPERSPELSDDQKWDMLVAWVDEQRPWPQYRPAYLVLDFTEGGLAVKFVPKQGGSDHSPSR